MSQVVLITGSSTGFGRDTAVQLARRGHHVFATMRDIRGRNATARREVEELARQERLKLDVLELDVTSDDSVEQAIDAALRHAGRLDVVVNNAGYAGLGVTEAFTAEQFQEMFDVNVFGVQRVNRAAVPAMRKQRTGLLVHVSSGAGRLVVPTMAAYCASKFAMEALADAYRYELLPFGINSVIVEPGIYRTPIFDRIAAPADRARADQYSDHDFAARVQGVFQMVSGAPDNPGTREVVEALVHLIEMDNTARPFRTVVGEAIRPLLEPYNAAAEGLRPIVAQIFNTPELAGPMVTTGAGS
jgi:NAD(P)-dependent dehydrogenase (short-subunit alcohol dehydrogenase family)